ncbi:MAG: VOC family protein [Pseudomonadota bacterium]|nr:VOC family protein [Pseudomonadota bacterium]
MSQALQLGHFGLRTRNLPAEIEWYANALNARVHFQNELAAFMSFDEEHHRFVLWDDGETGEKPEDARGVDHIGFGCGGPSDLADQYDRLKNLGIMPTLCVNHHFTSSLYYRDPDGNEVEITCDNKPTKAGCIAFMKTPEMATTMQPPLFGEEFDPEELLKLRDGGASNEEMARIGL